VYILIEREFIKCKESVYKIGRTNDIKTRLQNYPKGSKLLVSSIVADSKFVENQIIKTFKQKFKQRTDIGTEYFEGIFKEILKEFNDIVNSVVEIPTTQSPVPISQTVEVSAPKQKYPLAKSHSFESCTLKTHPKGVESKRGGVKQKSECGNLRENNLKRRPVHGMFTCECGFKCELAHNMETHRHSKRHVQMLESLNGKMQVSGGSYCCSLCDYTTSHKQNFRKHLISNKHKNAEKVPTPEQSNIVRPVMLTDVMDMFLKIHSTTLEKQKTQDTEMFKGLMDRMFCYQQQQQIQQPPPHV